MLSSLVRPLGACATEWARYFFKPLANWQKQFTNNFICMRVTNKSQNSTVTLIIRCALRNAETLSPSCKRFPQEEVKCQNNNHHRHNSPPNKTKLIFGSSLCHKTTDARKSVSVIIYGNHFRSCKEEPSASNRHHAIPKQWNHCVRHV